MKNQSFQGLKILLFLVALLMVLPKQVEARQLCTKSAFDKMRAQAYKVTPAYELKFTEGGDHFFEISLSNLSEGVELQFNGVTYSYEEGQDVITLVGAFQGGVTYEFPIYASYGYPCVGELLYTKKLQVPKYNRYSELEECIEYEEFPLCNRWYQGDISDYNYFKEKLNAYIESLKQPEPSVPVENPSVFEQIIDFYLEHLIITLPITIIFVGGVIFVVVRTVIKRKKRVKVGI